MSFKNCCKYISFKILLLFEQVLYFHFLFFLFDKLTEKHLLMIQLDLIPTAKRSLPAAL